MILKNNINIFWASLIIEELIRCGVGKFFISPGSRSTPLTVSVAKNTKAKSKIVFDERSAAFQALGFSKVSGKPAVLICTSGSAAANYYPAIIEAERSNIPLIVISADRPPELQNSGANQTFDQQNLYGQHVLEFLNLTPPNTNVQIGSLLSNIDNLFYKSFNLKGPVHLNCMYREPLAPINQEFELNDIPSDWEKGLLPYSITKKADSKISIDSISNEFKGKKTLVIIGEIGLSNKEINDPSVPILKDIQANIQTPSNSTIYYYDQILLLENIQRLKPEKVILIGRNIVSKRLLKFIGDCDITHFIDLDYKYDPEFRVKIKYISDYRDSINLVQKLEADPGFLNDWKTIDDRIDKELSDFNEVELSEYYLCKKLQENLQEAVFYISSSMPIRFMDMYFKQKNGQLFFSNRGVSGIDGVISSAIGAAEYLDKTVYLIIGDLAFYHDLNALLALKMSDSKLKIILINNKGGGIFRFLPISKSEDVFEDYFVTPHNFEFSDIIKQNFNNVNQISKKEEFDDAFNEFNKDFESSLLEIITDNKLNYEQYQKIQSKIKEIRID